MTSLSPNYKKISHGERFLNSSGNVIFAHYCETLHHPFELRPSCFFSLVNAIFSFHETLLQCQLYVCAMALVTTSSTYKL